MPGKLGKEQRTMNATISPSSSSRPYRHHPPRRGSVLILIVAVLMILAVLGISYARIAQMDRRWMTESESAVG